MPFARDFLAQLMNRRAIGYLVGCDQANQRPMLIIEYSPKRAHKIPERVYIIGLFFGVSMCLWGMWEL